jgi:hypothetical protein
MTEESRVEVGPEYAMAWANAGRYGWRLDAKRVAADAITAKSGSVATARRLRLAARSPAVRHPVGLLPQQTLGVRRPRRRATPRRPGCASAAA